MDVTTWGWVGSLRHFTPEERTTGTIWIWGPRSGQGVLEESKVSGPAANWTLQYQSHSLVTIPTTLSQLPNNFSWKLATNFETRHYAIFSPSNYFLSRISTYFPQTLFLNISKLCSSLRGVVLNLRSGPKSGSWGSDVGPREGFMENSIIMKKSKLVSKFI
jgi:hypothetical protein